MEETRNEYRLLVGKTEGKRKLEKTPGIDGIKIMYSNY
jgi:hypothetical protein